MIVKKWIIGTSLDCDVIATDEYISNKHCSIELDDKGYYWIEDLGSTNGTRIIRSSGDIIKVYGPLPMFPGDILVVGRSMIPWRRSDSQR